MAVRATVDLPEPLHDRLRRRAEQSAASVRSLIVPALEPRNEDELRLAFGKLFDFGPAKATMANADRLRGAVDAWGEQLRAAVAADLSPDSPKLSTSEYQFTGSRKQASAQVQ